MRYQMQDSVPARTCKHPDYIKNLEYVHKNIGNADIKKLLQDKGVEVSWGTQNTILWLDWKKGTSLMRYPIPLNQSLDKFIEEWNAAFGIKSTPIAAPRVNSYPFRRDAYAS